jgi:hypothetical protein
MAFGANEDTLPGRRRKDLKRNELPSTRWLRREQRESQLELILDGAHGYAIADGNCREVLHAGRLQQLQRNGTDDAGAGAGAGAAL